MSLKCTRRFQVILTQGAFVNRHPTNPPSLQLFPLHLSPSTDDRHLDARAAVARAAAVVAASAASGSPLMQHPSCSSPAASAGHPHNFVGNHNQVEGDVGEMLEALSELFSVLAMSLA